MIRNISMVLCLFVNCIVYSQTWNRSDIPLGWRIDDLSFIDDTTGFTGQSTKIYRTDNQGKNWKLLSTHQDFYYIRAIEFLDTLTGFVGTLQAGSNVSPGLFKTIDGGLTFQKIISIGNYEGICSISHFDDIVIATGTYAGPAKFYISSDRGETFKTINLDFWLSSAVDCHIVDKDTIYVSGKSTHDSGDKPMIVISTDGGNTWKESLFFDSKGAGYIWKMYFGANHSIFASVEMFSHFDSTDNVMFVSNDSGSTWSSITIDDTKLINYGGICIRPDGKGWIGSQHEPLIFETTDSGQTWSSIINVVTSCNRIHSFKNGNAVATGRTIYYYGSDITNTETLPEIPEKEFDFAFAPNPVLDQINLTLSAGDHTYGIIEIYNLNGMLMYAGKEKGFDYGETLYTIDLRHFEKGIYFVVWRTNHKIISKSIVKH